MLHIIFKVSGKKKKNLCPKKQERNIGGKKIYSRLENICPKKKKERKKTLAFNVFITISYKIIKIDNYKLKKL